MTWKSHSVSGASWEMQNDTNTQAKHPFRLSGVPSWDSVPYLLPSALPIMAVGIQHLIFLSLLYVQNNLPQLDLHPNHGLPLKPTTPLVGASS